MYTQNPLDHFILLKNSQFLQYSHWKTSYTSTVNQTAAFKKDSLNRVEAVA